MKRILYFALTISWLLLGAFRGDAVAQFVVDSGTPDEASNLSVFFDSASTGQFAAQEFTLAADTKVSQIEAYLGGPAGNDDYHIFLTTAIGAGATAADVVDDFFVPPPGTLPNAGVWTGLLSGTLDLPADTYYLVFATDVVENGGGFLPVVAPNDIGDAFTAADFALNITEPYASDFSFSSFSTFGVRVTEVPEPAAIALVACCLIALPLRRK